MGPAPEGKVLRRPILPTPGVALKMGSPDASREPSLARPRLESSVARDRR